MTRAARLVLMMIRPPVAAVLLLFAALGLASTGRADGVRPLFTTVLVVVAGWFVNATVLNDLADERIDRINLQNARGRPLVSGDATRAELLMLGLIAGGLALAVGWTVAPRLGIVVTSGLILNVAYSLPPLRLSARGLVTLFLLPLGYVVLPFLVGAYSVGTSLGPNGGILLAGLYLTFIGRIALKDFRDVRGDGLFGKRTMLVRHGTAPTCLLSAACIIVGSSMILGFASWHSVLAAVFAAYAGCALHGIRVLARAHEPSLQHAIIASIASICRGMGITLLTHFTMTAKGWSTTHMSLVHVALGLLFVAMYRSLMIERESEAAATVRPY